MSQTAQQNAPAFVFQEHLEYDGEQYDLVFDPGNPQRAQVIPNYETMIPQPSSVIQKFDLPGVGKRWMAIIDAMTPAQSSEQTGGLPAVERHYLCFRIYSDQNELPRAMIRKASGGVELVPSPLAARPQEMVIYSRSTRGKDQGNRAQRLVSALLGAVAREFPAPNSAWTQELARVTQTAAEPAAVQTDEQEEANAQN